MSQKRLNEFGFLYIINMVLEKLDFEHFIYDFIFQMQDPKKKSNKGSSVHNSSNINGD